MNYLQMIHPTCPSKFKFRGVNQPLFTMLHVKQEHSEQIATKFFSSRRGS